MENTFDMAYRSFNDWTSDQCTRMLDALKKRLSDEVEKDLDSAGLFDGDPLYQPVTEQQFKRELLEAQEAYRNGDFMDALAFCDELEENRL